MQLFLQNHTDNVPIWSDVFKLGEYAAKDTSEILKNTIIDLLNSSVDDMLEVPIATGDGFDGYLRIFKTVSLTTYATFSSNPVDSLDVFQFQIPF